MDIEPLLVRLSALAPAFGRAREDIEAMVTRGRGGDYKGVMQNCRLVLEALLRALVSDELKQTPGKAMLDELITRFRQQANSHLIPTNILAHMGTVQAWGNLSSHDHATGLSDDSVKVGKLEVLASLNSMVAILEWYAGRYAQTLASISREAVTLRAAAVPQAKNGPPVALMLLGLLVAGGIFFAVKGRTADAPMAPNPAPQASVAQPSTFAALDALYRGWDEPLPPPGCRSSAEAATLGARGEELAILEALPVRRSAEAWYLIARARMAHKLSATDATTQALGCAGFAAAFNLAGKIAVRDERFSDALPSFQAALDAAPDFHKARYNLGVLYLKVGRISDGVADLKRVTAADPKHAEAHFWLAVAHEGQHRAVEAKTEFCAAFDNGMIEAKDRCSR